MHITAVEATELFIGSAHQPRQIVRVTLAGDGPAGAGSAGAGVRVSVRIEGPAVRTPRPATAASPDPGQEHTVEVGVELAAPVTEGSSRWVTVMAEYEAEHGGGDATGGGGPAGQSGRAEATAEITAAVPGWTMWMVSHFHYDPVWWNTQAQFTESRLLVPDENGKLPEFRTAFELVGLHMDMARQDPDYKFVLAEIDYLKPYFDTHPERRPELKRLISEGRVEIVGGNYNEPNTNLTCAESTVRNAIYGIGYQRDVLGGDPATAWMLDVFGHDPSYPSLMASAGLTSSAWARGPFHQWGPKGTVGDNTRMQFPSEFEWMSPDGNGLLTAYMPNHYGAGWAMQSRDSLEAAEREAYAQFRQLKPVAATRNVLLPVGADHVIPCRWATPVHRDWNARYVWPKFVTAIPREFFAAARADAAQRDIVFTTQTRDMNPVYPGKDVSYIDTKQAQRAAETAVMDGERLATLAWLHGAAYPDASLDKAWRQLVFGAHHDAITGTESDQVYLDLLAGWREAYERGDCARRAAVGHLADLIDIAGTAHAADTADAAHTADTGDAADISVRTRQAEHVHAEAGAEGTDEAAPLDRAVVVFNTLATTRAGLVTITLRCPRPGTGWLELRDRDAARVPALAEGVRRHQDGTLSEVTLTFRATEVPGLGYRTYWAHTVDHAAAAASAGGWSTVDGTVAENAVYRIEADPRRGGALTKVLDKRTGTQLLSARQGSPANELVIQDEYDYHPRWNEGPWLLMPKGPGTGSATVMADVCAQRCPIGTRLVASWAMADLRVTQETLLWDSAKQVEFRTHVDGSIGHDRLLRVRFPLNVPGGLPVYETAAAVIGRPFGPVDTDVGKHWFTLDNPAYTWFGLGAAARVIVRDSGGGTRAAAIGVAEVITPGTQGTPDGGGLRGVAPPGGEGRDGGRVARQSSDCGVERGDTDHSGSGVSVPPMAERGVAPGWQGPDVCRETTRSLIAALAQQGVTATCSVAGGPRYGAIDLDSNLPDVRIALGGPEVNGFTAEVLAAADPAYGKELAQRLEADGAAALWVPAAQTRAAAFVPGADVTGARDLPVLIISGAAGAAGAAGSGLEEAVGTVIASLASGEVEAVTPAGVPDVAHGPGTPDGPGRPTAADDSALAATPPLAAWSAALLNRGTPGCVVTTEGSLNISLMRSCSGWPSGVWIDAPKRTAPDGSSFSWQHWSHTFEYALVSSGAGERDWRDAGFVEAGQAYNHPLLGCETGIHPGPLPATASLFPIEIFGEGGASAGDAGAGSVSGGSVSGGSVSGGSVSAGAGGVVLAALKPRGNQAAGLPSREQPGSEMPGREQPGSDRPGRAGQAETSELTVRLREPSGRQARIRLRPPGGQTNGAGAVARVTNLLEERDGMPLDVEDGNAVIARLPPAGTVTLTIPWVGAQVAAATAVPVSVTAQADAAYEPAQPVFTRYWLHGKGSAPAGNLPVAVHVSPGRATIPPPGTTGSAASAGAAPAGATSEGPASGGATSEGPASGGAGAVSLRVTVRSGPAPAAGSVELDVPDGLTADVGNRTEGGPRTAHSALPYDLPYNLSADGYAAWDVTVRATDDRGGNPVPPGRYFLAARIRDGAGQVLEDVATIAVGEQAVPPLDTPLDELLPLLEADERATAAELDVTLADGGITLAPGGRGELVVRLANHARSQIRGEAQLVSPFGTWDTITPWTRGFTIEPGAEVTMSYDVTAPAAGAAARPGAQWWALVKVCYFGRVRYTGAIRVSIAV